MRSISKKFYIFAAIFLLSSHIYADEIISIDNIYIQEYKGKLGKWELVESISALEHFSKKYGTPFEDIFKINDISGSRITYNYYFIPFSSEYLNSLKERGRERDVIKSSINQFIWPLNQVIRITSVLGYRNNKFHPGLDIPAARGQPIVASMEGVVIFAGYASGYGRTLVLQHRDNFVTRYSHNSVNFVRKGEFVKKGQVIGLIGSTGNSTGNHLHFEVRCRDIPLDPLDFLPRNNDLKIIHTLKNWK